MPRLRNELKEVKEDLAYYFQELAHGIATTTTKFSGKDELVNFAVLDILTGLFHSMPVSSMQRFISNVDNISGGLKKFYEEQKSHDSAS